MTRITQITIIALLILLLISTAINVIQYQTLRPTIVETVTVRDTISRIDTVVRVVTNRIIVDRPVPVLVDTASNIRTYRDTIYHQYGTIRREETVSGELMKKDIEFDLQIPEITRTLTVNNTITRTVRSPLLFATGGVSSTMDKGYVPVVGITGVSEGHRWMAGFDYSLDKQWTFRVGITIFR